MARSNHSAESYAPSTTSIVEYLVKSNLLNTLSLSSSAAEIF